MLPPKLLCRDTVVTRALLDGCPWDSYKTAVKAISRYQRTAEAVISRCVARGLIHMPFSGPNAQHIVRGPAPKPKPAPNWNRPDWTYDEPPTFTAQGMALDEERAKARAWSWGHQSRSYTATQHNIAREQFERQMAAAQRDWARMTQGTWGNLNYHVSRGGIHIPHI